MPPVMVEAAARPPAVSPERRRKVRRSMVLPEGLANVRDRRGPATAPFVVFLSMD
jgi:hypothetical protein